MSSVAIWDDGRRARAYCSPLDRQMLGDLIFSDVGRDLNGQASSEKSLEFGGCRKKGGTLTWLNRRQANLT